MGLSSDLAKLSRLERVESLKNMLVAAATGGTTDEALYFLMRKELLAEPSLAALTPRFVRTCRTTGEFWQFIKQEFPSYAERREFLREQFDKLLTYLEVGETTPHAAATDLVLRSFDEEGVGEVWTRMLQRQTTDPEGAITAARTLVETVCKHILDELGETYSDSVELPSLYGAVAAKLNLGPSQHTEQVFKQILGGCMTVVNGLAAMRNKLSDAHGKGKLAARPAARHAELAVNLAASMTAFLVATWMSRRADDTRR
jgi:Abortive infection C-terminus